MGDIVDLAHRYREEQADELVFYDITASPQGRSVEHVWVSRVAAVIDIPFCVAGGIRDVRAAEAVLNAGADKISVNTPALENPALIDELAKRFGSQCVVVGIDSRISNGDWHVFANTGDPEKTREAPVLTMQWVKEIQERGAGEIVLNCMSHDGVRTGYDLEQLAAVRERCRVPLIASGGAGEMRHFADVFASCRVDGALAATVFHSGAIAIPALKTFLRGEGIEVRQ